MGLKGLKEKKGNLIMIHLYQKTVFRKDGALNRISIDSNKHKIEDLMFVTKIQNVKIILIYI